MIYTNFSTFPEDAAHRINTAAASGATEIDLNALGLNTLPPEIGVLTNLAELEAMENDLISLPKEIGQLTRLVYLNLWNHRLTSLPSEIGFLTALTSLGLGSLFTTFGSKTKRLTSLPKEIGQLINLVELDLQENDLTSLPEEIWQLTNLETLKLIQNKLSHIATGIGRLTNLGYLYLGGCNLSSLPSEIGKLTNLRYLTLSDNRLTALPMEIEHLMSLTILSLERNQFAAFPSPILKLNALVKLNLSKNQLTSLPAEFGQLTALTNLDLSENYLTSLPLEFGNLTNLQQLTFYCNLNLKQLPLTLGQIPGLTELETMATEIDDVLLQSILDQCKSMRDAEAPAILPLRLAKWKAIAKSEADLQGIDGLTESQKIELNEWLVRLEKTRDFAKFQSNLAHTVCEILQDFLKDNQALFFSQVAANNERCEDRAAMSLNEIYTSWKIVNAAGDLRSKLQMMTGPAKTLCLRKEIAKRIARKEEPESVEIYLYYETQLKDRLHLMTAIESMAYGDIGKREWIDEEVLVQDVNAHFFDELYELPIFQKLLSEDEGIQVRWDEINPEFYKKLEGADGQEVMMEWKSKKMSLAKEWYDSLI